MLPSRGAFPYSALPTIPIQLHLRHLALLLLLAIVPRPFAHRVQRVAAPHMVLIKPNLPPDERVDFSELHPVRHKGPEVTGPDPLARAVAETQRINLYGGQLRRGVGVGGDALNVEAARQCAAPARPVEGAVSRRVVGAVGVAGVGEAGPNVRHVVVPADVL